MPDLDYSGLAPAEAAAPPPSSAPPAASPLDFSGLKPLDFSGLQPIEKKPEPTESSWMPEILSGALHSSAEVGQTAGVLTGEKPTPLPEDKNPAHQPLTFSSLAHPGTAVGQALY